MELYAHLTKGEQITKRMQVKNKNLEARTLAVETRAKLNRVKYTIRELVTYKLLVRVCSQCCHLCFFICLIVSFAAFFLIVFIFAFVLLFAVFSFSFQSCLKLT